MTLAGHARPHDFRQAIDIHRHEPEPTLKIAAHGFAPRLGSEKADLQGRLLQVNTHFLGDLCNIERVGWRGAQHAGLEIIDQGDLTFGSATR